MRGRLLLTAALALLLLAGCRWGERDAPGSARGVVTVYSTTDTAIFAPVIADFHKVNPAVELRYVELDAAPLFDRFLREADSASHRRPSVQLGDGSAGQAGQRRLRPAAPFRGRPNLAARRAVAERDFGLTFEPVVMVASPALLAEKDTPRTRFDLVKSLRERPEFWRGRIGTYDIERSSVGYLLAAQDARQSSEFGALVGRWARRCADIRQYVGS